ncbi:biosynthetic peptidoglycan transglycosylase [Ottowia sp.]|uniref:biosynthetic peptidoglycan transglycosylase n=1 Tax=Ottowia sp. TaxID=1898956 RepID=UPI003A888D35
MKTAFNAYQTSNFSYQKRSFIWLRRLAIALIVGLLCLTTLAGSLWFSARHALAPQADEWAIRLGSGPFKLHASVPKLVWVATHPTIGQALAGTRWPTRYGPIELGWVPAGAEGPAPVLTLHCQPCTLPLPAGVGQRQLTVPALQVALSRDAAQPTRDVRGTLLLGAAVPQGEGAVIHAFWHARRQGAGWDVQLRWPEAPARHWLALLAPDMPELATAHISGSVAAQMQVQLPEGDIDIQPQINGLTVTGLGTERWAHARTSCGPHRPLPARHWLTRAVLAAEDQRFAEHPGYDLEELRASLSRNQQAGAIRRGASTLTQQLAKLMVAGPERSLQRKLRELLYALDMERNLGKPRILQLYLSMAPWGQDAQGRLVCGAQAAAQHYFGVPAARLTPHQAVTLAAMLHSPGREARQLAAHGNVDIDRVRWIAHQVRGVPARQRRALAAALAQSHPVPGLVVQAAPAMRATRTDGPSPASASPLVAARSQK